MSIVDACSSNQRPRGYGAVKPTEEPTIAPSTPLEQAEASAKVLRDWQPAPRIGIVLGSGLGNFADTLNAPQRHAYADIPYFPATGVVGHSGELIVGQLPGSDVPVAVLSGRAHLYEGHSAATVVHATRSMARWGVRGMIYTNAAGSTHRGLKPADLMLLTDHLNFTGHNPLCGPEDPKMGPRFLDMGSAYDPTFQRVLRQTANDQNVPLKEGVYAGLLGPSYETPAEVRAYQTLGADAVGMSTVLEVIAAHQLGVRVAAISCITNYGAGVVDGVLSHDEVKETAQQAQSIFTRLLHDALGRLHHETA